jgi:RNA polymerase sigma-70 factor, ECF subfamily
MCSVLAGAEPRSAPATHLGFDDVYRLHAAAVHRFCLSQAGNRPLAEDLTHETFAKAFVAYERVRPDPASTRTWLLAIARNLVTDHHRRRSRWRRLLDRMPAAPRDDVEMLVDRRDRLRRVTAALAALAPRDRELIGLRVAADLSYREVAKVLGSTEPVVKVATHRALNRLRARLETTP